MGDLPAMSGGGRFDTTRWSIVRRAAEGGREEAAKAALAELCRRYWSPLYAWLRRSGRSAAEAEDLVQGFFLGVLARDDLSRLGPDRGRFRSWLLTALRHHIADVSDHETAQKRGGNVTRMDFDFAIAEKGVSTMASGTDPEAAFEKRWALELLDHTFQRLRREQEQRGAIGEFERLKDWIVGEGRESQLEIARGLDKSPGSIKVAVHRLRRRFREILREEVAETVSSPDEIDDELAALRQALS